MLASGKLALLSNEDFRQKTTELATELGLAVVDEVLALEYPYVLTYTAKGLALQQTGAKADGPVSVEFTEGASAYRRNKGGGELIVKAVSGNKSSKPSVLDVTAGLGRDSFVLASFGYQVTALERSPIAFNLLRDGLERARLRGLDDPELKAIAKRLEFICTDAIDYLNFIAPENPPDVVLIDPMFPHSKKSALVKKDMRAFQTIIGPDSDSDLLLQAAKNIVVHRVVVKRPKKAEFLAGEKPNFSVEGKAIRFDIYTKKSFKKN